MVNTKSEQSSRTPRFHGSLAMARIACCAAGISSCDSTVPFPESPDMDALNETYDHPDGRFSEQNVQEVIDLLQEKLESLNRVGGLNFITETLQEASAEIASHTGAHASNPLQIRAKARINLVCDPSTEEGTLSLEVLIDHNQLLPTIWGTLLDCLPPGGDMRQALSGPINLSLGQAQPLADPNFQQLLIQFPRGIATPTVDQIELYDLRLLADGAVEFALPASNGSVVGAVTGDQKQVELRSAEGSFCCYFEKKACYQLQSQSCDEMMVGDEVWTWE